MAIRVPARNVAGDQLLDSVTVGSNEQQVVQLSDSRSGGLLCAVSSGLITLTATASLRIWGLFNPAGSGKTLYVHRIFGLAHATAAASTIAALLQETSDVTTTGTALTVAKPFNDVATPVANPRNLPTAGTVVAGNYGSLILPTTSGAMISNWLWYDEQMPGRDLVIPAGTGILLQASGTPNINHRVQVDALWTEA